MIRNNLKLPALPCLWLFFSLLLALAPLFDVRAEEYIDLGGRDIAQWQKSLTSVAGMVAPGAQITSLSAAFLDIPYREGSLIGGPTAEEVLVLDLSGVDCFTLLDYIEAFRQADDFSAVMTTLKEVRYRKGQVDYRHRHHFFSDWPIHNGRSIIDVTRTIGQDRVLTVNKQLNLRGDGSFWLPGIPVTARPISYIPTGKIDAQVLEGLRSGDYLGIYSERPGLDVSHTGVVIRAGSRLLLRHASSRHQFRRVVDMDLLEYLQDKPGILVYRGN